MTVCEDRAAVWSPTSDVGICEHGPTTDGTPTLTLGCPRSGSCSLEPVLQVLTADGSVLSRSCYARCTCMRSISNGACHLLALLESVHGTVMNSESSSDLAYAGSCSQHPNGFMAAVFVEAWHFAGVC